MGRAVSATQQNTRDAIVKFLENNTSGTIQEFIGVIDDDDNNIRRAIRFLKAKQIIIPAGKRTSGSVGNPPTIWKLQNKELS